MSTKNSAPETVADREIVISRLIGAPRELVFEAWTDPKHIIKWWGPRGFTHTFQEISVKPGGVWRFIMHGPDSVDYPNYIVFDEIVKPELITYTHGGTKEGDDVHFKATITFVAQGNKTRLTLRMLFGTAAEREQVVRVYKAIEGGNQHVDRLEEHLAGMIAGEPFVVSRTFDAPRGLVWKACTEPERMRQWFGPKGFEGTVAKMDFRVGGWYHYCLRSPDGSDLWGRFTYRHIQKPELIIFVSSFSDKNRGLTRHPMAPTWPAEMLSTFTLTEKGGKTTFTVSWTPINATAEELNAFREGFNSMKQGWAGTMERFTEYLTHEKGK